MLQKAKLTEKAKQKKESKTSSRKKAAAPKKPGKNLLVSSGTPSAASTSSSPSSKGPSLPAKQPAHEGPSLPPKPAKKKNSTRGSTTTSLPLFYPCHNQIANGMKIHHSRFLLLRRTPASLPPPLSTLSSRESNQQSSPASGKPIM